MFVSCQEAPESRQHPRSRRRLRAGLHTALVHGVPIVTTQPRVHLPELIDGQNVLLVPREDSPSLAQALLDLSRDPALRRRLGAGALALSTLFRWDKIAADTLALYHAACTAP